MKTNNITRITALTLALAVICGSAASCGSKAKSESSTAQELLQNSYKSEPIDCGEEFGMVSSMTYSPETQKVFFVADKKDENIQKLFITDLNFTEFKEAEIEYKPKADTYFNITSASDGTVYVVQTLNEYGDLELPDFDDPDFDYENYDFEAMEEARVTSYKIMHIDSEGKILSESDIKDMDEKIDDDAYFSGVYSFGKDKLIAVFSGEKEKAVVIDTEGKITGDMDFDDFNWIVGMTEKTYDKFIVCGYSLKGIKCQYIDTETLKPTGEDIDLSDSSINLMGLYKGSGDHIAYLDTNNSLLGLKSDGTTDEIINWTDSDVSSDYGRSVIALDNGEFIIFNGGDEGFMRLTKRDSSEFANTNVITLGMLYDDGVISEHVKDFNKAHDNVRIKTVDYSKYNQYDEESMQMTDSGEKHLTMDIVSGKAPDMIVSYNNSLELSMASKGIFADLGEFLKSDNELSEDDIMPNVIEGCKVGGKLISLSPTFSISTMAVKKKFFDKENWTFEDLRKTYEKLPKDTELTETTTKSGAFYLLKSALGDCIDYSKGTCNFDSDIFKDILEFCSQFKDDEELMKWYNEASEEELTEFFQDSNTKYKDERALVYTMYLSDFRDYKTTKEGIFNEDITLVGFPTSDGTGAKLQFDQSYAILENSSSKNECWEFIKTFFTDESYEDDMSYGFPSLKSAFEKKAENASKPRTYKDEDGNEHEIDDTMYINGQEIKVSPLTDKEKEYIINYVKNTTSCELAFTDEIDEIITDCMNAYFKNEKSVDETIELINSKVSILLSEQK